MWCHSASIFIKTAIAVANSLNVGIDVNVECSVKNANKKDDFVNNENSNGKMYKKETNCCNDGTNKIEIDKSEEVNESSMKDPIKRAENENNRMTDNKVQGDKLSKNKFVDLVNAMKIDNRLSKIPT
nr:hypothetical protein [Tanacetum cinerariifolium]